MFNFQSGSPLSILVVGINQTLVWNVAHSLKRQGLSATILAPQAYAPIRLTTSCKRYVKWTSAHLVHGELTSDALNQVVELCDSENITQVIPVDYETSLLFASNAWSGPPLTALPSASLLRQLHDKWQLSRVLEQLNVPFPNSERINNPQDLSSTNLSFPIITKPLSAWASLGFEIHHSREELLAKVNSGQIKAEYPLIAQEFAPGWDVGFSMIANHGKLVAYCMFSANKKRTRTFFEDERLLKHIKKVVAATQYHGIGNWDARYDPVKDEYKILELNPRFWSSQLYSTNAEINFPYIMAKPELWDDTNPIKAKLGDAYPTFYERLLSVLTRRINHINNLLGL